MAKYLIDLDLLIGLFNTYDRFFGKIKTINKPVELYVISVYTEKIKLSSLIGAIFKNNFVPSKQLALYSKFNSEDLSFCSDKIIIHIIKASENKIDEARKILPDIQDIESAVELLYAKDLDLDVVITERPHLFKYQESEDNKTISWSIMVEDTDYLLQVILHQDDIFPELNKEQVQFIDDLVRTYGQEDWGNWHLDYDKLESNLDFIQEVLGIYLRTSDYARLKNMWKGLNRFCDLYNKHDIRLKWLSELAPLAIKAQDWNYYVSANTSMAWTQIMLGELTKAYTILENTKNYLPLVTEKQRLISFYYCLCTYHIHFLEVRLGKNSQLDREHFLKAKYCIYKQQQIISELANSLSNIDTDRLLEHENSETIDSRRLERYSINSLRNSAKLNYVKGNLDDALQEYKEVEHRSIKINHLRSLCYAHSKLADIYLDFAENSSSIIEKEQNIHKAQKYLFASRSIATTNKNNRRIAAYYTSEARLSQIQGKEHDAINLEVRAGEHRIGYQNKRHALKMDK